MNEKAKNENSNNRMRRDLVKKEKKVDHIQSIHSNESKTLRNFNFNH